MPEINRYRIIDNSVIKFYGWVGDASNGAFNVPVPFNSAKLLVIASTGGGWDHVSVSLKDRIPTWREMEYIKRLFFKEDETAMQLHVPSTNHINIHENCLHLWRPTDQSIPMPPELFV